jgi:hypothetical protein
VHGAGSQLVQRRAGDVYFEGACLAMESQLARQPGDLAGVAGEAGGDLIGEQKAVCSRMDVRKFPFGAVVTLVRHCVLVWCFCLKDARWHSYLYLYIERARLNPGLRSSLGVVGK